MRNDSLKLIEDVIGNFAKLASVEISGDSIYLEFIDVELGNPKNDADLSLSMRFAKNSFFTVFYDNIWDIDFISNFNYKNHFLQEELLLDVGRINTALDNAEESIYTYTEEKKDEIRETWEEGPIIINGDVTNAPDNEYLTQMNSGGTNVITLKNTNQLAEYGKVYIRVANKTLNEILQQFVASKVIYVIEFDINLSGGTIDFASKADCALLFNGGKIKNGTINGNNTYIYGLPLFEDMTFTGTFANSSWMAQGDPFSPGGRIINV